MRKLVERSNIFVKNECLLTAYLFKRNDLYSIKTINVTEMRIYLFYIIIIIYVHIVLNNNILLLSSTFYNHIFFGFFSTLQKFILYIQPSS